MGNDINSRTTINIHQHTHINITINDTGGADAVRRTLNTFDSINDRLESGSSQTYDSLPGSGTVPSPNLTAAGVPAGKGLQQGPEGWPTGTVQTAGGYNIVPEGNHNWSVYAPGQKHGEKAHTRVHGDPHVTERDGTKWDFTKDSDFVLPDGTRIFADTDYDKARGNGQSLTQRLVITNGQDRVEIDELGKRPQDQTQRLSHDAYEWRALHLTNPEAAGSNKYGQSEDRHDAFHLRGDRENVQWARERNGRIDGVVTGDRHGQYTTKDGNVTIYDQNVQAVRDANTGRITRDPTAARELRPPVGSRAWGNQLRSQYNDFQAQFSREVLGKEWGALNALGNSYGVHADHINGQFQADMLDWMFGGLPGYFNDYMTPFNVMNEMVALLRSDSDWRQQFRFGTYGLLQ